MRVLVCGDREWADETVVQAVLHGLFFDSDCGFGTVHLEPFTLIEGCARGADAAAHAWGRAWVDEPPYEYGVPRVEHLCFPAHWRWHDREGRTAVPCRCPEGQVTCKAAGPRRNQQMLDEGKPEVAFAFHDYIENSRGTKDMVKRLESAGVPVYVIARRNQAAPLRLEL